MKNILPPPISLFIVKKNQRILPSCERQFGLLDDVRPNQVDNFKWKPAWPLCFFFSFFIFFSRWIIVKLPLVIFSNTSKRPKYVKPKFVQDHWNNLHRSSQPFLFLTINSKNEKAYFDFDSLFLLPHVKEVASASFTSENSLFKYAHLGKDLIYTSMYIIINLQCSSNFSWISCKIVNQNQSHKTIQPITSSFVG